MPPKRISCYVGIGHREPLLVCVGKSSPTGASNSLGGALSMMRLERKSAVKMRSWLPIAAVMILAVIAGAASASPSFSVALRTFFHDWEPVFVGMGTIALAAFTWRLWLSTDLLWEHTRVVERAYIKLAHSKALEHDGQGSFSVCPLHFLLSWAVDNSASPRGLIRVIGGCDGWCEAQDCVEHQRSDCDC